MIFGRKDKTDTPKATQATEQAKPAPVAQVPAAPVATVKPAPVAQTPAPAVAAPVAAAAPAPAVAATAPAAQVPAPAAPDAEQKELQARRAMGTKMISASIGEIISIFMRSPGYKHFSLADLEWLLIPPVLTNQFSMAEARKGEDGIPVPVAVVLWASVSPEVDKKLSEDLAGPMRLRPDEWKSGDILWMVNAVGSDKVLDQLIANLHQSVFKGRPLKMRVRGEDGKPVVKIQQLPTS